MEIGTCQAHRGGECLVVVETRVALVEEFVLVVLVLVGAEPLQDEERLVLQRREPDVLIARCWHCISNNRPVEAKPESSSELDNRGRRTIASFH